MTDSVFLGCYADRIATKLPGGYVVGTTAQTCKFISDSLVSGVRRKTGLQCWYDQDGNTLQVCVEAFDLDASDMRNWATFVE